MIVCTQRISFSCSWNEIESILISCPGYHLLSPLHPLWPSPCTDVEKENVTMFRTSWGMITETSIFVFHPLPTAGRLLIRTNLSLGHLLFSSLNLSSIFSLGRCLLSNSLLGYTFYLATSLIFLFCAFVLILNIVKKIVGEFCVLNTRLVHTKIQNTRNSVANV